MNERNPRSKLRQMKRRYFAATMLVYLFLFPLIYLVCEIMFMIFETGPYTKLAVLLMFMVIDGVVTDHIINRVMKNRWQREAPDILDEIKAPEPAYIPDGPVPSEAAETVNSGGRKRLHRTQHKELEEESHSAQAEVPAETGTAEETSAAMPAEKRRRFTLFRRKESESSPEPKPSGAKAEARDSGHDLKPKESERKTADKGKDAGSEKTADQAEAAVSSARTENRKKTKDGKAGHSERRSQPPKPSASSAWASSIDEMETVGITEAVSRIEQAEEERKHSNGESVSSGKRSRKRKHRSGC